MDWKMKDTPPELILKAIEDEAASLFCTPVLTCCSNMFQHDIVKLVQSIGSQSEIESHNEPTCTSTWKQQECCVFAAGGVYCIHMCKHPDLLAALCKHHRQWEKTGEIQGKTLARGLKHLSILHASYIHPAT